MRTVTATSLVVGALRLLQVVAAGETPNPTEVADGVGVLNDLIDDWATQALTIPITTRETFPLDIGEQEYSIGDGGDFDTVRPQAIDAITVVRNLDAENENEIDCDQLTYDGYISIATKKTRSPFPTQWYYDPKFNDGRGSVFFWPIPNEATIVAIYAGRILAQFDEDAITTDVILPPAYARALRYNLALELLPEYPRPEDSDVARIERGAREGLANLKRQNDSLTILDAGGDFGDGGVWTYGRFLSGP